MEPIKVGKLFEKYKKNNSKIFCEFANIFFLNKFTCVEIMLTMNFCSTKHKNKIWHGLLRIILVGPLRKQTSGELYKLKKIANVSILRLLFSLNNVYYVNVIPKTFKYYNWKCCFWQFILNITTEVLRRSEKIKKV